MVTVDFKRLPLLPGAKILDIGCGSGRHTAAAYELFRTTVIGVDLSLADLAKARERLLYHDRLGACGGGSWWLAAAEATCLPFADGTFDVVICSEVLEHIAADAQAVKEIVRVLKPGGKLAVSVPRFLPERICWALSTQYHQHPGGHLRIYRRCKLVRLIEKAGTRHFWQHHAHSLHTPYWWLKCLLGIEKEAIFPVKLYQRLLTWDIMTRPRVTRLLENLLNPVLGKSLVLYFTKHPIR
jgi:ubiquinone/menaquinone biosynthesis C-methylase UbiE